MARLNVALNQDNYPLTSAAISFSGSGSNQIVAGVTGQIIKVWKILFIVSGATAITYEDGSNPLSGALGFSSNEGMVLDFDTQPWYVTSAGNALNLNSSNAVQVSGTVWYTQA